MAWFMESFIYSPSIFLCLFFYQHVLFKYVVMMMTKNALCAMCINFFMLQSHSNIVRVPKSVQCAGIK